jgi:hypothetical protein
MPDIYKEGTSLAMVLFLRKRKEMSPNGLLPTTRNGRLGQPLILTFNEMGEIMKRSTLLLLTLLFASFSHLHSQDVNDLIQEYNDAFFDNDYFKAKAIIDDLLEMTPGSVEYKKEQIKMLALTGDENNFVKEMILLRNCKISDATLHFFELKNFPRIPQRFIKSLKVQFEIAKDEFILNHWDQIQITANNAPTREPSPKKIPEPSIASNPEISKVQMPPSQNSKPARVDSEGNRMFIGPRGGIYHYSKNGKKVYHKN